MGATTVRANLACLGLARYDVVTIERTPFVDAVIANGYLTELHTEPSVEPTPVWQCPVCLVERTDVQGTDWLDSCPNCTTTLAPELGL
jgi:hypothetical protein